MRIRPRLHPMTKCSVLKQVAGAVASVMRSESFLVRYSFSQISSDEAFSTLPWHQVSFARRYPGM